MKIFLQLILILWIVMVPVLIISSTVNALAGSFELYKYGFQKYKISKVTGINDEQLKQAGKKLIDYLNGRTDSPQIVVTNGKSNFNLYNDIELTHLGDVRNIVQLFKILQIVSIAALILAGILLYARAGIQKILGGIQLGSILTIGFTVVLISWALIDFQSLFYLFHMVSFSNDLWILDPSKDYLIMMFPQEFFNDAALFMIATIIIVSLIILTLAFSLQKVFINSKSLTA